MNIFQMALGIDDSQGRDKTIRVNAYWNSKGHLVLLDEIEIPIGVKKL